MTEIRYLNSNTIITEYNSLLPIGWTANDDKAVLT